MFSTFSTAISGLTQAVARATHFAGNVVNASSTGKNIDGDLVNLKIEETNVAANALVIKTAKKMDKALLDMKA